MDNKNFQHHAPPPAYNMGSAAHPPPPVTVTTMSVVQVGPTSTALVCPSCHATVLTRVEYNPSTRTHTIAAILCIFMCIPCAALPYCMNSCQNADHNCPNCNAYLGSYKS